MIVRPHDVLNKLTEYEEKEMLKIEEALNHALSSYEGRPMFIDASFLGHSQRLRSAAQKACEKAGWKVRYISDQRDGDCFEFSH